ncbi:MAG: PQQ-dependent sugar dehydrogenase [Planctomycetes bacterium]|nr:PQQ-dependent sugar dehydrogenase [Planctomycetota bacterium]
MSVNRILLTAVLISGVFAVVPADAAPIVINLDLVADGLTAPLFLTHAGDGSGRLFIVDQPGQIRIVKNGVLLPAPFLDISSKTIAVNAFFDERGLLGLAFHPDYANNGRFFIRYSKPRVGDPAEPCNNPAGFIVGCHEAILAEYNVGGDTASDVASLASEIILVRADEPQFNHNSGQVAFGPDGLLYWTLGDGGGAHDGLADAPPSHGPDGNGQNIDTILGSVLRIDVDSPPGPGLNYAIPPGNPFAAGGGVREIYAYGFRNPYRFSFDDGPGGDGSLYVADVGQNLFEEVDIVPVEAAPGLLNYGWVIREGFSCFDPFNPTSPPANCATTGPLGEPLLDPVMDYDHSVGIAIIGGFVYRGSQFADLGGRYVFGDFSQDFGPTGRLFYMTLGGPQAFQRQEFFILPNGDPLGQAVFGIGEDEDGELYVLASDNIGPVGNAGVVYHIARQTDGRCCLSDGSCFISDAGLCSARAGSFGGAGSICEGDADGDGIDDACDNAIVPAVSTWGMIALILTLCTAMAIKFSVPRRRPTR